MEKFINYLLVKLGYRNIFLLGLFLMVVFSTESLWVYNNIKMDTEEKIEIIFYMSSGCIFLAILAGLIDFFISKKDK